MIITIKKNADQREVDTLISSLEAKGVKAVEIKGSEFNVYGLTGDTSIIDEKSIKAYHCVENVVRVAAKYKLANRMFHPEDTVIDVNGIRIGRHTLIGADALILDNDMHYPRSGARWGSTLGKPEQGQPISIGEGCFIGARATILKGVTIGSGSVVAAGAVVTRDVPPGCLAIGNPAVNKPLPERLKHPRETQKAICP